MSIQNPSNLYYGNAAVVDSRPSVNLAVQIMQKQQAKRDALDQYERSRINSINDAGLRDNDRKRLDDSLADLQSYYQQNKAYIQKGNTQHAFDYEKKFRGVRDLIAASKDRAVRHHAALKFYNDRLKQDQRLPDDFMKELGHNDMPLGSKVIDPTTGEEHDPNPFDITKWVSEAKPFNQQTFVKSFADIKGTPSIRYEKIQGQPLKQNEITETKFDKDALSVINARAADKYDNSYSFATQVQDEIKDPTRRKELSDLFTKHYGVTPNSMSDYATAYSLELMPNAASKIKAVDNKDAIMDRRFAEQKVLAGIRNFYATQRQLAGFYHSDNKTKQEQEETNQWVDSFIDNGIEASKKYPLINGKRTVPLDPVTAKALIKSGIEPTGMQITEDGKTFTPIYPTYKDGAITNEANISLSQPLDRESLKLNLGYKTLTKKELGNTMKGKPAPTNSLNASERRKK